MGDNGTGTIDIDKLLEERGKTHGNHVNVYDLVWELWSALIENEQFRTLPGYVKVEIMMILFKVGRGINKVDENEHWNDVQGYAELIKRVECQ